jgi:protein-S-isoprenylcysteine O-methyltransferase Ste14
MFFDISPEQHPYIAVGVAFALGWLLWLISWMAAAFWASKAAKRPPVRDELLYRVLTVGGAVLMFLQFRFARIGAPVLWLVPVPVAWALVLIQLGGFALTWWARIHLGTLWSGRVTRKDGHWIVDTGPYGVVRHPIYTGLLASLYATVLPFPGLFNVAGVALLTIAFVVKARLEERFLMQELGGDAYAAYKRRVPMLVPFWPMPQ